MIWINFLKYAMLFLATALLAFITIRFSQKERDKNPILKICDGKKEKIFYVILLLYFVSFAFGFIYDNKDERVWKPISSAYLQEGHISQPDLGDQKTKIIRLVDRTRWYLMDGGDYESYHLLWEFMSQNKNLEQFIKDQISGINDSLKLSYPSVETIPLCKQGRNIGNRCLEVETKNNFEVNNVRSQLLHPQFWVSRAKSAYLLQFLTQEMMQGNSATWEKVLDSLYNVFKDTPDNSNNLLTRYMAWEAFRIHTCFTDEDTLFNAEVASKWWENQGNRKKVLEALEQGDKSPYCKD